RGVFVMTVFDAVRNAVLAGFGVQEKVKEFIDELVKKGELSESQGAKVVREWSERADRGSSDLNKNLSELMSKTLEKINIPTKEEFEQLNKRVQSLSVRVRKLEDIAQVEQKE
ncbi:MAG TPA: phasin family protein, partial [Bacteroidota bacterium]|nr:phasin family protein [Bacteroidota bacterium]